MDDKRNHFAVAIHASRFLIISGGVKDSQTLDSVLMYDIHSDKFTNLQPMIKKRCKHSSLSVSRWVVVVGGSRADSIELLDMKHGEFWYEVRPQVNHPLERFTPVCAINYETILVCGTAQPFKLNLRTLKSEIFTAKT